MDEDFDLSEEELRDIVLRSHRRGLNWSRADWLTIDDVGLILDGGPEPFVDYARPPSAKGNWRAVQDEFLIFLCSKEKKYASLKNKIKTAANKSQLAIVSMIAAAIGTNIGVAAGVLVPLCALCLIAVLKVGKESFCKNLGAHLLFNESKHK
jgi:hypothetical protein